MQNDSVRSHQSKLMFKMVFFFLPVNGPYSLCILCLTQQRLTLTTLGSVANMSTNHQGTEVRACLCSLQIALPEKTA